MWSERQQFLSQMKGRENELRAEMTEREQILIQQLNQALAMHATSQDGVGRSLMPVSSEGQSASQLCVAQGGNSDSNPESS